MYAVGRVVGWDWGPICSNIAFSSSIIVTATNRYRYSTGIPSSSTRVNGNLLHIWSKVCLWVSVVTLTKIVHNEPYAGSREHWLFILVRLWKCLNFDFNNCEEYLSSCIFKTDMHIEWRNFEVCLATVITEIHFKYFLIIYFSHTQHKT